jgi:hypothetical protein
MHPRQVRLVVIVIAVVVEVAVINVVVGFIFRYIHQQIHILILMHPCFTSKSRNRGFSIAILCWFVLQGMLTPQIDLPVSGVESSNDLKRRARCTRSSAK